MSSADFPRPDSAAQADVQAEAQAATQAEAHTEVQPEAQAAPVSQAHAEEQAFVDVTYARVDALNEDYRRRLDEIRRQGAWGTHQARSERDSFASFYENNLLRLRNVEHRLVLGRLDYEGDAVDHIGRISVKDDNDEILLLDWRAPQSRPFYQATALNSLGVRRRRHIQTFSRKVVGIEDEILDADATTDGMILTGEGALMAALSHARTGKMGDIVATIQREQDDIIRDSSDGIMVVQGGPGTGKTAVALHRAAYLLYTERKRLERSGVLIICPSTVFLSYIDSVLPSLGESDVVATTIEALVPHVNVTATEPSQVAAIKGRAVWKQILTRAVHQFCERPATETAHIQIGSVGVRLTPADIEEAQGRARRSSKRHNEAWEGYATSLVELVAQRVRKKLKLGEVPDWLRADIAESVDARRAINLHWLPTSPADLVRRLFARPDYLAAVAPELTAQERALLYREREAGWTRADVALLDYAAEVLGPVPSLRPDTKAAEESYISDTMRQMNLGGGIVTTEMMRERWGTDAGGLSLAERAAGDREWTYGHVIVDEAQELTPMEWDMIVRRNPMRSMTIVGDLDQRHLGDGKPWEALLAGLGAPARVRELTVAYRSPRSIMTYAREFMASRGVQVRELSCPREVDGAVERLTFDGGRAGDELASDLVNAAVAAVGRDCAALDTELGGGHGTAAVVTPPALVETMRHALADAGHTAPRVQVMDARTVKGLEFDCVTVVDPGELGSNGDIYVALTRATRHLTVCEVVR